ncbi:MAG: serine protease [Nitrospinae bacterium]|nr:serine protease [Nitrospinota bacterium]
MIEQTIPKEMLDLANIQAENEDKLLGCRNVVGVALGHRIKESTGEESDENVLSVLVNHKVDPQLLPENDLVPKKIKNTSTDVVEVGDIFAGDGALGTLNEETEDIEDQASPQLLRRRIRPARGGFSIGHYKITAGTLGTCCYDLSPFPSVPRRYYILSNNHVLANVNDARIGDPILQPGPYDGGNLTRDRIARLSRFVPIQFISGGSAPCNYVDAAIAEGRFEDLNREIYWVGYVKKLYTVPKIGDIVQKTGRTTNFTTGKVLNINGTINVNYGNNRVARFCRQIITTDMSAGGDSGSLVTNLNEEGVGLLFAGSSTRTIINNIWYVQAFLNIRITER